MYHSREIIKKKACINTKLLYQSYCTASEELLLYLLRLQDWLRRVCARVCVCVCVCVSNVSESVIKQSVTAVAVLSHSAADRHKQAHTRTRTHMCTHAHTRTCSEPVCSSPNSSHLALLIWAQCGVNDMHLREHLSAVMPSGLKSLHTHTHTTKHLLYSAAFLSPFFAVFQRTCLTFVFSTSC